jgi:hypothetical protein
MDFSKIMEVMGLVVGSGAISSFITNWFNKRKSGADTDSVIVGNIMDWALKLSARIDKLEAQLVEKDKQIDDLIEQLHKQDLLIQELQKEVK